jgi:hypothetical protein
VILLPLCLEKLADLTDDRAGRFALGGVHVEAKPDGGAVVAATDTKVLGRVEVAPGAGNDPNDYPDPPTADVPATAALVPADAWKETFSAAKKLTRRCKNQPVLQTVAAALGANEVRFKATDLERTLSPSVRTVEGRFPPADEILRDVTKAEPVAVASFDPKQLADLLRVVAETCSGEVPRVTLEFRGDNKPLVIRVDSPADGLKSATFLIMPLPG